jgi:hypothetical protein
MASGAWSPATCSSPPGNGTTIVIGRHGKISAMGGRVSPNVTITGAVTSNEKIQREYAAAT